MEKSVLFQPVNIFQNFFSESLKEFQADSTHDKLQEKGVTLRKIFQNFYPDKTFYQKGEDMFFEILEKDNPIIFSEIQYFEFVKDKNKRKNTIVPICNVDRIAPGSNVYTVFDAGHNPGLPVAITASNYIDSAGSPDNPRQYSNHTSYSVGDIIIAKTIFPNLLSTNSYNSIYTDITANYIWQMTLYYCLKSSEFEHEDNFKNAIFILSHVYFRLQVGNGKNKKIEYYLNPSTSQRDFPKSKEVFSSIHMFVWGPGKISETLLSLYNDFKVFSNTVNQPSCCAYVSEYVELLDSSSRNSNHAFSHLFADITYNTHLLINNMEDTPSSKKTKAYMGQILKYAGDTSHIVFRRVLKEVLKTEACPETEFDSIKSNAFIIITHDRPLIYRSLLTSSDFEGCVFNVTRFFQETPQFKNWVKQQNQIQDKPVNTENCYGFLLNKKFIYQNIVDKINNLKILENLTTPEEVEEINNKNLLVKILDGRINFVFKRDQLNNEVSAEDKITFQKTLSVVNGMLTRNYDRQYIRETDDFFSTYNINEASTGLLDIIFVARPSRIFKDVNPNLFSRDEKSKFLPSVYIEYKSQIDKYYSILIVRKKYGHDLKSEMLDSALIRKHINRLIKALEIRSSKHYANGLRASIIDYRESSRISYIHSVVETFKNILFTHNTQNGAGELEEKYQHKLNDYKSILSQQFQLDLNITKYRIFDHLRKQINVNVSYEDFINVYTQQIQSIQQQHAINKSNYEEQIFIQLRSRYQQDIQQAEFETNIKKFVEEEYNKKLIEYQTFLQGVTTMNAQQKEATYEAYKNAEFQRLNEHVLYLIQQNNVLMNVDCEYMLSLDTVHELYNKNAIPTNNIANLNENESFLYDIYYYNSKINEYYDTLDYSTEDIDNFNMRLLLVLLKENIMIRHSIYKDIHENIKFANQGTDSIKNFKKNLLINEIFKQYTGNYTESNSNCITFYQEFKNNMKKILEKSKIELKKLSIDEIYSMTEKWKLHIEKSSFHPSYHLDIPNEYIQIYNQYIQINNYHEPFQVHKENNGVIYYNGYSLFNLFELRNRISKVIELEKPSGVTTTDIEVLKNYIALFQDIVDVLHISLLYNTAANNPDVAYFYEIVSNLLYLEETYRDKDNTTYYYEYNLEITDFYNEMNRLRNKFAQLNEIVNTSISQQCTEDNARCVDLRNRYGNPNMFLRMYEIFESKYNEYKQTYTKCELYFEYNQNTSVGQEYETWIQKIDELLVQIIPNHQVGSKTKAGVKKRGRKTIKHKKKLSNKKKKKVSIKKSKSKSTPKTKSKSTPKSKNKQ